MSATNPISMLSDRVNGGEQLLLGWCSLGDPTLAQALARIGFDAVLLDMQHGAYDLATIRQGIALVAGANTPTLVRIPVGEYATVSRVFDAGAAGVVAPMINSADDARGFVEFAKYAPTGGRSWGPTPALALSGMAAGDYLRAANGMHLAIAMVETRSALDSLDEILAVDGIDGVLVGPSDLSLALTDGELIEPHSALVQAALETVLARCRAHGKLATVFCANGERANELFAAGFQVCAAGTDAALFDVGARAALTAARAKTS
jgi:4-hydroxy-2-oxoheptanedioate aldolase